MFTIVNVTQPRTRGEATPLHDISSQGRQSALADDPNQMLS